MLIFDLNFVRRYENEPSYKVLITNFNNETKLGIGCTTFAIRLL